ncbi:16S rRNA (guanine966-N2)-methyltransferase [Leucobacter exalbidus]|uniref:16S rRNA (Guanine966-N2)-methyltransferase n=1 Tax=Leucobacter exalbidus TaxID=662960 RepID=A0A940T2M4_9MICO|nr:16S rRNA (guanine966-N2)-methyltransferase [Leucobacter exalbidus]
MTRIISGVAGSLRLEVPQAGTRPTSDRVREAIFSTLVSWGLTEDARVLDLYAGSGALGLESASRGAASVTLVEKNQQAAGVAERNWRTIKPSFAHARVQPPVVEVAKQSVQAFLDARALRDPAPTWDVVFLDPPYDLGEAELSANLAALVPMLAADAAVLVERSSRSPEPTWPAGLEPVRDKRHGETALWWAEPTQ